MEKLKVGDKVCLVKDSRWYGMIYKFSTVDRLTKTQAVLSDGTKLINEPKIGFKKQTVFSEYGDRWERWELQTNEIVEAFNKLNKERKIDEWFSKYKFSQEEKEKIYNDLNGKSNS